MDAPHSCTTTGKHVLTKCHECDYYGGTADCESCEGRGYFEVCVFCGEPMGNARRKWKRQRRNAENEGGAAHHVLKCWPQFFGAIDNGTKTFEVRAEFDRTFAVGDTIALREWDPEREHYTGQIAWVDVTYTLRGYEWGLRPGYVVLGIQRRR